MVHQFRRSFWKSRCIFNSGFRNNLGRINPRILQQCGRISDRMHHYAFNRKCMDLLCGTRKNGGSGMKRLLIILVYAFIIPTTLSAIELENRIPASIWEVETRFQFTPSYSRAFNGYTRSLSRSGLSRISG